ncbi:hypothetical protein INT47_005799 [Mucor saturninus]|uniref:Dolichyl-diphosphooligosaccharide-protein glycosyltransferase subunit OST5 n=1 Tax=Mucor saturninus TaxID=64648 RepID=A0A8H7QXU1_9FUNG|nr:hypothetical protein INT47_005799 [Mucor saturninus]
MTAHDEWMAGTPLGAPLPTSSYPLVTFLTIASGLFAAGQFVILDSKTPLLQQIKAALLASVLLGFGAIFASNAAGVYV